MARVGPGHHGAGLQSLLTSSVASWVASTSVDGHIMIWDQDCETCIRHLWLPWQYDVSTTAYFPFFGQHHDLIFAHPEGVDVAIWGIHGNKIASLRAHLQLVLCCAWSPEGDWLASASSDEVHIWRTSSFYPQSCEPRTAPRDPLLPAPFIDVHASHRRLPVPRPMGDVTSMKLSSLELYIFNFQDTAPYLWNQHDGSVTDVNFSSDGTLLLSTSVDMTIMVTATGSTVSPPVSRIFRGHESYVNTACFSPDGKFIASASEDRTVRLWGVDDSSCLKVFTEHTAMVSCVAFSPNGRVLYSGGRDGTICRHADKHKSVARVP
ncbi:WD40-repeat-containing domain protein [Cerioporus squamosus]|nr:WD40-repeat-containing domain protein [Cerioporus squamosus]